MHNFITLSFAGILAEAHKYALGLVLSHQYIEQLDEKIRAAIFGNVGTIITFRVGTDDANLHLLGTSCILCKYLGKETCETSPGAQSILISYILCIRTDLRQNKRFYFRGALKCDIRLFRCDCALACY